ASLNSDFLGSSPRAAAVSSRVSVLPSAEMAATRPERSGAFRPSRCAAAWWMLLTARASTAAATFSFRLNMVGNSLNSSGAQDRDQARRPSLTRQLISLPTIARRAAGAYGLLIFFEKIVRIGCGR